jgi:hypothetical protein
MDEVSSPRIGGLPDPLITKKAIKRDLDDISDMSFWRLQNHEDPARRFPPPDVRLGGRDLWHQSTAERYIEAQKELYRAAPPRPRPGTRSARLGPAAAEPTTLSTAHDYQQANVAFPEKRIRGPRRDTDDRATIA